jgi:hypothetical protein
MKKIILAFLLALCPTLANAQTTEPYGTYVNALPSAGTVAPSDQFYVRQGGTSKQIPWSVLSSQASLSAAFDAAFCGTTNAMLVRGASLWACQTTLPAALMPALTGDVANSAGSFATTIQAGVVTNAKLANTNANTWKGNATGSTGAPSDNSWTNCNGANSAVNYTNGTGTGCNANVASLNTADQTLAGGANVTQLGLATGNVTIDCGSRPLQSITASTSAWTITAPSSDGSCLLLITNPASAVTPSFSGFSVGASTGDALTTTNGSKFTLSIWRINGTAGYRVAAHQ